MINQITTDALGLSSEYFIVKDFYLDKDQNKYISIYSNPDNAVDENGEVIDFIQYLKSK